MRGYKVTDWKRSRIFGIACQTLDELKVKGCRKLQLDPKKIIVRLQDGTFLDDEDYFKSVAPQTLFLFVLPNENAPTGYEIFYNMLCAVHKEYLTVGKMASEFITQDFKRKVQEIAMAIDVESSKDRASLCSREEDPDWFRDLETNASSKEAYMSKRSQERIRGYLYKSQDDIKRSDVYIKDAKARAKLDDTFALFKAWLKKVDHFSCYFNRNCSMGPELLRSLCDSIGEFLCQGKWNALKCQHNNERSGVGGHSINPYVSRETRIIFSTWNLDHRIERSRRIGPALIEAAKHAVARKENIDTEYFFSLLFTRANLKLVHIVCHDKGEHHGANCSIKRLTTVKPVAVNGYISLVEPV